MPMLPPGVSESDWTEALNEFAGVIGRDWVFADDDAVELYKDPYSVFRDEPEQRLVSAAVAPYTVEEVQGLMRIANRYRIPMYPISTGKNLGHGGAEPNLSGSVILDLKRMNRIVNVDDRNHSILVEPGVTFYDFYDYVTRHNLDISVDIPDPAWGSFIGNALEHGLGHTNFYGRDRFQTCNGMEVVLADGTLVRTGAGAVPKSTTWQDHRYGYGPHLDGIFSQANYGVVTKMGFWARPAQTGYRAARIRLPRRDDLHAMIDADCYLSNAGIINGMWDYASDIPGTSMFGPPATDPNLAGMLGGGYVKPDVAGLEKYAADNGHGYWQIHVRMHGPEKITAAQWEFAKDYISQKIPGATFEEYGPVLNFPLSDEDFGKLNTPPHPQRVYLGIPSLARFSGFMRSEMNQNPTDGHLFYSPIIQKSAEDVFKSQEVFAQAFEDLQIQGPNFHFAFPLFHFPKAPHWVLPLRVTRDREVNRNTRRAYIELLRIAGENGWADYRAAPPFQDALANLASFNDHSLLRMSEKIKDALDPNGIISAGRGGIWPQHMREDEQV